MNRRKTANILLVSGVILCLGLATFFHQKNTAQIRADKELREIAVEEAEEKEPDENEQTSETETMEDNIEKPAVIMEPEERQIDFAALKAINPDVVAWLYIPGTSIDYPILCATEEEGADYYLRRNIYRKKNSHGCIYYRPAEPTILYGHNMHDGTMFGQVKKYKKKSYQEKHRYLYVYRLDESGNQVTEKYSFFVTGTVDPAQVSGVSKDYDLTLCTCTGDHKQRVVAHFFRVS